VPDLDGPEEYLSLDAMISALRDGEPVDRDAMRDALLARAEELGLPRRDVARFAGQARWEAERRAERDRGEEETG
jgi:hypothetical protein